MGNEFTNEFISFLKANGMERLPWGVKSNSEWVQHKQIADNDYRVIIRTHNDFEKYKEKKDLIVDFFRKKGSINISEKPVKDVSFGYWTEIVFLDKEKHERQMAEQEVKDKRTNTSVIHTEISGTINTGGGNLNTGYADDLTHEQKTENLSDKKWFKKEIVKMILSFIAGVGATLLVQWIMRLLGWI